MILEIFEFANPFCDMSHDTLKSLKTMNDPWILYRESDFLLEMMIYSHVRRIVHVR